MSAKANRALRRETKRTLGHHLEQFVDGQGATVRKIDERGQAHETRLALLEEAVDTHTASHVQPDKVRDGQLVALMEIRHRGFFGRLNWLVTGR